jgi:hypothetical protein
MEADDYIDLVSLVKKYNISEEDLKKFQAYLLEKQNYHYHLGLQDKEH